MTSLQIKLAIYGAVVAALIGTGAYFAYRWYEADMLRMEIRVKAAEAQAEQLKLDRDSWQNVAKAAQTISIAQVKLHNKLMGATNDLDSKIGQLAATKPEVRDFVALPVPDDIRRLRRSAFGCDPNPTLPCPGSGVRADAGTANDGRDSGGAKEGSGQP